MIFSIEHSIEILERTPDVLESLLKNLSDDWVMNNEGVNTWSPFDVVGHLIHGEKTDWIPRMEIILSNQPNKSFVPFDRFAQFKESKGKTINQLLDEFKTLRMKNVEILKSKNISANDLKLTGKHPAFGEVTLEQLLSTWLVHDLNHIYQISRAMASQYKEDVGPWIEYLKVLRNQ